MIMKARLSHPASKENLNVRIELIKFQAKHWSVGMSQGLNTPRKSFGVPHPHKTVQTLSSLFVLPLHCVWLIYEIVRKSKLRINRNT